MLCYDPVLLFAAVQRTDFVPEKSLFLDAALLCCERCFLERSILMHNLYAVFLLCSAMLR